VFALETVSLAAPLPRAYQWVDASAYPSHVERVRGVRGAEPPPDFLVETLERGAPTSPFLRFGGRVRIEMLDREGASLFGAIEQVVICLTPAG
jgi:fumarylacetoacetate (FAA) hydrolase